MSVNRLQRRNSFTRNQTKPHFLIQNTLKLTYSKVQFKKLPGVGAQDHPPPLKGRGRGWGRERRNEVRGVFGDAREGWSRAEKGERGRDRDRGGEKGVPPHSTIHFNHCVEAVVVDIKKTKNVILSLLNLVLQFDLLELMTQDSK